MKSNTFSCRNCGATCHAANYQCEACGSFTFTSNDGYTDFNMLNIDFASFSGNGPERKIYIYDRLLAKGERPLVFGAANYGGAGGKLLLTNKSLLFSAHAFNVGKKYTKIDLTTVGDVKVVANMIVSQRIVVIANGMSHKFVVYQGADWVERIRDAVTAARSGISFTDLQQLKQLLDMGVITEEEFTIKKRMILGI